jgi:hypothetical protein
MSFNIITTVVCSLCGRKYTLDHIPTEGELCIYCQGSCEQGQHDKIYLGNPMGCRCILSTLQHYGWTCCKPSCDAYGEDLVTEMDPIRTITP